MPRAAREAIAGGAGRRDGGGRLWADPAAVGARRAARSAASTSMPACCRAGAARRPSTARSRRATPRPASPSCRWTRAWTPATCCSWSALPIGAADTTGTLHDQLAALGGRMIVEALELAACGGLQAGAAAGRRRHLRAQDREGRGRASTGRRRPTHRAAHPRLRPLSRRAAAAAVRAMKVWRAQVVATRPRTNAARARCCRGRRRRHRAWRAARRAAR